MRSSSIGPVRAERHSSEQSANLNHESPMSSETTMTLNSIPVEFWKTPPLSSGVLLVLPGSLCRGSNPRFTANMLGGAVGQTK